MVFLSKLKIALKMVCFVVIFVTLIASGASAIAQTAAPTTSTKTEAPTTPTQEKTSKPEEKSPQASAPQGSCNWYSPGGCVKEAIGLFQFFKLENLLELFFRALYIFTDLILGNLVRLSSWLFELSLNLVVDSDMALVEVGWNESLKIANSLFILIFLGMAISIILGISSFGKARLPQFIMVILLINFSMVIGLVIINFSNSLTQTFSDAISQKPRESGQQAIQSIIASEPVDKYAQSTTNITTRLNGTEPLKLSNDEDSGFLTKIGDSTKEGKSVFFDNLATLLFKFISKIFTYLLLIFVFLAGAVYMITRTFWLWLLLMISPLAWIAFLIPSLEKHWKAWWEQFIKWNIFAPAYLFFLFLGMKIAEASPSLGVSSLADAFQPDILIQSLIVGFVMLAGLSISSRLGVGGSNFIMSYADSAKNAASKKFSELRSKSPLSAEKLGEKFGGMGARGLAAIPGIGRIAGYRRDEVGGRLELDRQKQRQEDMEKEKLRHTGRMAGMNENQKRAYLMNLTTSTRSGTGATSLEQSAAINMLMEDKVAMENISEMEQGYMRQAVAATTSSTQRDNITVPYSSSLKARAAATKESREGYKKDVEREMGSLASADISTVYQIAQRAMSTGTASAKDAAAMRVLQDRKVEASHLFKKASILPEEQAKFWSNAKLGIEAAEKGKTSTSYIR